jgi:hypothetical protein
MVGRKTRLLLLLGGRGGVVLPQLVRRQLLQLAGGQARDGRAVAGGGQVHAAAPKAARRQWAAPIPAVPSCRRILGFEV